MTFIVALLAIWVLFRRRERTSESLMRGPLSRILLLLVVVGLVVIAMTPEVWFVLPAFDAIGLDVVTILVALELQRHFQGALRLVGFPAMRHSCHRVLSVLLEVAMRGPGATHYVNIAVMITATVLVATAALVQHFGIWRPI